MFSGGKEERVEGEVRCSKDGCSFPQSLEQEESPLHNDLWPTDGKSKFFCSDGRTNGVVNCSLDNKTLCKEMK